MYKIETINGWNSKISYKKKIMMPGDAFEIGIRERIASKYLIAMESGGERAKGCPYVFKMQKEDE